jgi:hypothetical protein
MGKVAGASCDMMVFIDWIRILYLSRASHAMHASPFPRLTRLCCFRLVLFPAWTFQKKKKIMTSQQFYLVLL